MIATAQPKIVTYTLLGWIAVLLAIKAGIWLAGAVPFLDGYSNTVTALVLLYAAFFLGGSGESTMRVWAWDQRSLTKTFKYFLIVFAVLPLIVLLDMASGGSLAGLHFVSRGFSDWANLALHHLLVVAVPEEFFFRGYMQGRLSQVWVPKKQVFGASFGKAQVVTSLLFAVSHSFITFQGWHIFIFFPALLFAWLKEKTGVIWAAALFHAACNLFSEGIRMSGDSFAGLVGDVVSQLIAGFLR